MSPKSNFILLTALLLFFASFSADAQNNSGYVKQLSENKIAIVYVHGFLGDGRDTWTHANKTYWPKLLSADPAFKSANVYVYDYASSLHSTFTIDEVAQNLRLRMNGDKIIDHDEIIFIAHSMGGIVVREYLIKNPAAAEKTRFLALYATPSGGTQVAELAKLLTRSKNPALDNLNIANFNNFLGKHQRDWREARTEIPIHCAVEKLNTYGFRIVTEIQTYHLCTDDTPINTNHIDIAKPDSENADQHILIRDLFVRSNKRADDIRGDCQHTSDALKIDKKTLRLAALLCRTASSTETLSVRYFWLNASSASVLMSGTLTNSLKKLIGENPTISENSVTTELRSLIATFGIRPLFTTLGTSTGDDSDEIYEDRNAFRKRFRGKLAYDGEHPTLIPDIAFLRSLSSTQFPPNMRMFYSSLDTTDPTKPTTDLVLWRYLERSDLLNYGRNIGAYNSALSQSPIPRALFTKQPNDAPKTVQAMLHFTRNYWPTDFLVGRANIDNCSMDLNGMVFVPRELHVLVAVLDSKANTFPISSIILHESPNRSLRLADPEDSWKPTSIEIPSGELRNGETLVIPLQLELRLPKEDIETIYQANREQSHVIYKDITSLNPKSTFVFEHDAAKLRKVASSFKPSEFPEANQIYLYGPRFRLNSFKSGASNIALRQPAISNAWTTFGQNKGSCPTLYVRNSDGEKISYGRILIGASSPQREREETIEIEGPVERIELIEEEPEVSTLKYLRIFVTDIEQNETLALELTHQRISPFSPLTIETPSMRTATKIRVEVRGYYEPMSTLISRQQ